MKLELVARKAHSPHLVPQTVLTHLKIQPWAQLKRKIEAAPDPMPFEAPESLSAIGPLPSDSTETQESQCSLWSNHGQLPARYSDYVVLNCLLFYLNHCYLLFPCCCDAEDSIC